MPDPTPTDLTEAAHYAYNEAVTVVAQWLHANSPDIGALLGIPAPATRPLARPKWSPRSFNSGEEEGSIYCPACNWTTSGHESPCDNAWFEHATEAHPERPIQ